MQQWSGEEIKEKELREAEARAKPQTFITEAELSNNIQSNQRKAAYERSRQGPLGLKR